MWTTIRTLWEMELMGRLSSTNSTPTRTPTRTGTEQWSIQSCLT